MSELPARPLRLLMVVNVGWFFVSHRLPVAIAARRAGYEVHVAAALEPKLDDGTAAELAKHGLIFHPLRLSRSGAHPCELLRDLADLLKLYRRVAPDLIHLVALKPVLLGGLAARFISRAGVVLAVPGRGAVFSASGAVASLRRWLALLLYRLAYASKRNRVIVQNVEDREYFVSRRIFAGQDVRLIRGSGVDIARFTSHPEAEGPCTVLLASRMLKEKGVADFVAAATVLRGRGTGARFVLVGQPDGGSAQSHSREELEAWRDSGIVEWWGFRADMGQVFRDAHIVCLPTYYGEGVPKVLIEAAACGRPIVTTDVPGCRDIVRHCENGLLINARDVAGLVSALDRLIADGNLRRTLGSRGRQIVETEFTLDTVIRQTLDIYGELRR